MLLGLGGVLMESGAIAATPPSGSVYIVTSAETYRGIGSLASAAEQHVDSSGNSLVLAEIGVGQEGFVSQYVHEHERRCGGYFAFDSREEAAAFLATERSGKAIATPMDVVYAIDNQETVDAWLPAVDEAGLLADIAQLSSYKNRWYGSTYGRDAASWIHDTWQAIAADRGDVTVESFMGCGNCSTQPSIILTITGAELPEEVVVLGAHLDSIRAATPTTPEQVAPGADDDASGVATLTEVLRVALADGWKPKRTVKVMAYAAEEVGLRGSNAIASRFAADGVNVIGVLQLDMTNYQSGDGPDMRIIADNSNLSLQLFMGELFDAYLAPQGLTRGSYRCGYGCSDHASWTNAGFPAAMMFEAGDVGGGYNPSIHTNGDTLANMGDSAANSAKFARFGLAFLGELAKTHRVSDSIFVDGFESISRSSWKTNGVDESDTLSMGNIRNTE